MSSDIRSKGDSLASGVSGEASTWFWSGPASLDAVREAAIAGRDFLKQLGVKQEEYAKWELLLTEAGNNSVFHGNDRTVSLPLEIEIIARTDRITAYVTDHTCGFDWPTKVTLPDPTAESGRGLFLIETLTDSKDYRRGRSANTLVMERSGDLAARVNGHATVDSLEETLTEMTEELGACYESLAVMFQFTAESRSDSSVEQLGLRLLEQLTLVTGADSGVLRLFDPTSNLLETTAALHCSVPHSCVPGESASAAENAAVATRQDHWFEAPVSTEASNSDQHQSTFGLIHPFYNADELIGIISLERHRGAETFRAGDVNVLHTLAHFFTQKIMSWRHQSAVLEAKVAQRELEVAAEIQRMLLPLTTPACAGLSCSAHCESALAVGGDFYDIISREERGVLFIIADVMGKGIGASMMAAVTRSVVRSVIHQSSSPARILEDAANLLFDDLDRLEMFVTAAVGCVDLVEGVIHVANAGHCPVIISAPGGDILSVKPNALPLGLEATPRISQSTFPLQDGMRLFAFTDGLTDPRSLPRFESTDAIIDWFRANTADGQSADQLLKSLLQHLGTEDSTESLSDDQTFLFIGNDSSSSTAN